MKINGEVSTDFSGTVAGLLAYRRVSTRGVAVAVNGEIVPRSEWDKTVVPEGADIEIVTAAAGG